MERERGGVCGAVMLLALYNSSSSHFSMPQSNMFLVHLTLAVQGCKVLSRAFSHK